MSTILKALRRLEEDSSSTSVSAPNTYPATDPRAADELRDRLLAEDSAAQIANDTNIAVRKRTRLIYAVAAGSAFAVLAIGVYIITLRRPAITNSATTTRTAHTNANIGHAPPILAATAETRESPTTLPSRLPSHLASPSPSPSSLETPIARARRPTPLTQSTPPLAQPAAPTAPIPSVRPPTMPTMPTASTRLALNGDDPRVKEVAAVPAVMNVPATHAVARAPLPAVPPKSAVSQPPTRVPKPIRAMAVGAVVPTPASVAANAADPTFGPTLNSATDSVADSPMNSPNAAAERSRATSSDRQTRPATTQAKKMSPNRVDENAESNPSKSSSPVDQRRPIDSGHVKSLNDRGLPDLTVLRTAWHPDIERRSVKIRLEATDEILTLREGDAVGGLVIQEISPSAVVFKAGEVEIRRRVGQSGSGG